MCRISTREQEIRHSKLGYTATIRHTVTPLIVCHIKADSHTEDRWGKSNSIRLDSYQEELDTPVTPRDRLKQEGAGSSSKTARVLSRKNLGKTTKLFLDLTRGYV